MKKLLLSATISLTLISVYAQKRKPSPLFLDTTARKHELHLNAAMLIGPLIVPGTYPSGGFDLTYARVYKGTHHLRTGIGYISGGSSDMVSPNLAELNIPDTADYTFMRNHNHTLVWGKIGYEISINNRRTRFLFGADLMIGYTALSYGLNGSIGSHPAGGYKTIYYDQTDYRGLFIGINPRVTVRYNFSPLFSGGITTGLNLVNHIFLSERKTQDIFENSKFTPTALGNFDIRLKPELNLIFKIPEKKSRKVQ